MAHETKAPAWRHHEVLELMEALVIQAVETLVDGRCGPSKRHEVMAWIESDALHPFSFRACCLAAGYDPDKLRERLSHELSRFPRAA